MEKVELLSPAGDMEKLKTAIYFGADAVYIGGKSMSLRALAGNFSDEEIISATEFCHKLNKKIYVTVNIFAKNSDLFMAERYFKFLESAGIDGAIVSDTGLIALAKSVAPKLPINLSTQANTLNYKTVEFWKNFGVKRVILARELSLKEIKEIHLAVPDIEIETFIHGAMCISYSGRCLLSDYRTGRQSNRGECVQACRWNYEIRERGSDGEFMEIARKTQLTDIFLTSVNAISETGALVNIDGTGNRVAGSIFGHEKVYMVASTKKIEPTLDEAIFRARNVAAPTNTKKFGYATPCAKTGKCYDCHAPRRICNVLAIYMQKMNAMDVEVVLVGEDLGF